MILYLDSSSLAKLYVEEDGSARVRAWAESAEVLATSRVAFAEIMAALARWRREGSLDEEAFRVAEARLTADWEDFAVVEVDEITAGDLAVRRGLRGFDAIHLAAACALRDAADAEGAVRPAFSSFDRRQLNAARDEGLTVLDPEPASPFVA